MEELGKLDWRIVNGDCRDVLPTMEPESVQCVVTSPPYWGLRDYGLKPTVWGGDPKCEHKWGTRIVHHKGGPHGEGVMLAGGRAVVQAQAAVKQIDAGTFCHCGAWLGQLGLEPTPDLYVEHLVGIFREIRKVLREGGTVWLNLGDSYASGGHGGGGGSCLKPKDLCGVPWRAAFALQADGWWLRSDIVWSKPNPMPESVTDRPTRSHEYIFLLTKSARYYYDHEAISESANNAGRVISYDGSQKNTGHENRRYPGAKPREIEVASLRNKRSVWTVTTKPFPEAHFATFPPDLIEPCILAGSRENDLVLDPFCGSGTAGVVALNYGRRFVGIEPNEAYCEMARKRIRNEAHGQRQLFS